jgi:hypothetical protein
MKITIENDTKVLVAVIAICVTLQGCLSYIKQSTQEPVKIDWLEDEGVVHSHPQYNIVTSYNKIQIGLGSDGLIHHRRMEKK